MPPGTEIIFLIVIFGGLMYMMSRAAKKQRAQQEEARDAALVVGNGVRTIGGFYGVVVDIDGDAVTLESPSGIETVWFKSAISGPADPPFAAVSEDAAEETPVEQSEPEFGERTDSPEN